MLIQTKKKEKIKLKKDNRSEQTKKVGYKKLFFMEIHDESVFTNIFLTG